MTNPIRYDGRLYIDVRNSNAGQKESVKNPEKKPVINNISDIYQHINQSFGDLGSGSLGDIPLDDTSPSTPTSTQGVGVTSNTHNNTGSVVDNIVNIIQNRPHGSGSLGDIPLGDTSPSTPTSTQGVGVTSNTYNNTGSVVDNIVNIIQNRPHGSGSLGDIPLGDTSPSTPTSTSTKIPQGIPLYLLRV